MVKYVVVDLQWQSIQETNIMRELSLAKSIPLKELFKLFNIIFTTALNTK